MPAAKGVTSTGMVLPGWQSEIFQATAGPVMLALVPQKFLVALAIPSIVFGMVLPKILIITGSLYVMAVVGTMWEPYWYSMLQEYVGYASDYEG